MDVPHNTLFQNYTNGFAPPNKRAARGPDKKKTISPPEPLALIQNNLSMKEVAYVCGIVIMIEDKTHS